MARVLADPMSYQFLPDDPPSQQYLEQQYEYLSGGRSPDGAQVWLTWILLLQDVSADPIGFLQATISEPDTVHIAYLLNPVHWRQGYAREAVAAMLDVVFADYRVDRAIAEIDTRNAASISLVQALGFVCIERLHDVAQFKGGNSDEYLYAMERSAWQQPRIA